MDVDLAELASLVTLLKEADFSEFRYEKGDTVIVVRREAQAGSDIATVPGSTSVSADRATSPQTAGTAASDTSSNRAASTNNPPPASTATSVPANTTSAAANTAQAAPIPGVKIITAPMLGTFYTAPKPGERPFVQVGDVIERDSVLCIIEVMKLMNSVHAEYSGTVVAVHANDGDLVEFGQPLFSVQETTAP